MGKLSTLLLAAYLRALCAHGLDSALEPYARIWFPHFAPWAVVLATLVVSVAVVEVIVFIPERFFHKRRRPGGS